MKICIFDNCRVYDFHLTFSKLVLIVPSFKEIVNYWFAKLRWAWLEDGEMKELLKKSKPVDAMDIEREDENENLSAMFE